MSSLQFRIEAEAHRRSAAPGCAAAYCSEPCPSACSVSAAAAAAVRELVASPSPSRGAAVASACLAASACACKAQLPLKRCRHGEVVLWAPDAILQSRRRMQLPCMQTYLPCCDGDNAVRVLALVARQALGGCGRVDVLDQVECDVFPLL